MLDCNNYGFLPPFGQTCLLGVDPLFVGWDDVRVSRFFVCEMLGGGLFFFWVGVRSGVGLGWEWV